MGRPLYSRTFRSTPAVRDPEPPICERWSPLNAFDPDSDEFFDNENAVYEDFIDPVAALPPSTVEDVVIEEEEEEEERDMLVVRMGMPVPVRNASPIMSESSLSDSEAESPLAAGAEDPAHLVVDAFHDVRQMYDGYAPLDVVDSGVRIGLARRAAEETRTGSHMSEFRLSHSRRFTPVLARRMAAPYPQRDESLAVPSPSAPIPVPSTPRRSADRVIPSPSTPPHHTPAVQISMSPPPSSTPRLYSWARNPGHSASPSSGPFTNLHARTSYTHLSPALIRIRDVTV